MESLRMPRLPRIFLFATGLGLASLALYAGGIAWRAPGELLSLSLLRMLTVFGLVVFNAFTLAAAVILRKKPALERRIDSAIRRFLKKDLRRNGYLILTEAVVLMCLLPVFNLIAGQEYSTLVFLVRFLWLLFLIVGVISLTVSTEYFTGCRKRWLWITLVSSLLMTAGIFLQQFLLQPLTRKYSLGYPEPVVTQSLLILIVLALVNWLYSAPAHERNLWILVCITGAGLFSLQWIVLPQKYWRVQPLFAALAPLIILGAPLFAHGVLKLSTWISLKLQERKSTALWIGLALVLLSAGVIFYNSATQHAKNMNITPAYGDQSTFLDQAQAARRLNFNDTGNQNQMPLYPFFMALFYQPGMSDQAFFELGKTINIVLGLVFLLLMFLVFLKFFKPFQSLLLILIVAFSLFIFKAPYFQVEITFYFFFFISYLLMLRMLVEPDWITAIAAGILIGLTHLSKASVLPGFLLFTGLYLIKSILERLKRRPRWTFDWKGWGKSVALLCAVIVAFVVITFPYGQSMQRRFGNYFYNVNTSVYLWFDSWDEALKAEYKYKFQEKAPDLPEGQRPGLQKYLREHTWRQIAARLAYGFEMQFANLMKPYNVTSYPASYLWILLLAILADIKNCIRLARKHYFLVGFALLFFGGYFFAFSWYSPIIASPRFIQGLLIPLLFSIFYAVNSLAGGRIFSESDGQARIDLAKYFSAVNVIIAMTLIYNIWLVTVERLYHALYNA